MKRIKLAREVQRIILAFVLTPLILLSAGETQNEPQSNSLGDLAKKTRAANSAKGHIAARRVLNDENAPSANFEKHTISYWATMPPAKLTVSVPIHSRPADHGLEIPLDKSSVYMAFGETIWSTSFRSAAQEYLGMLLTRSRFRGAVLKLDGVEDTSLGSQSALLVHFSLDFHGIPHDGMALFVSAPEQVLSLGCVYRQADWGKGEPICEDMINSAEVEVPTEFKPFKKPF